MTKSTSQVLQEARALIERGWCQDKLHVGHGAKRRYCLLGAIQQAAWPEMERNGALRALAAASPEVEIQGFSGFNDLPTTTQADVLALFDAALVEVTK